MVDYFQLEGSLNEEERSFRDKVRKFVNEECMPLIVTRFDQGTFPAEVIPRMAGMGLFGVHIEGYGCAKSSHTIYGLVCQELGRCDNGLRFLNCYSNRFLTKSILNYFNASNKGSRWIYRKTIHARIRSSPRQTPPVLD